MRKIVVIDKSAFQTEPSTCVKDVVGTTFCILSHASLCHFIIYIPKEAFEKEWKDAYRGSSILDIMSGLAKAYISGVLKDCQESTTSCLLANIFRKRKIVLRNVGGNVRNLNLKDPDYLYVELALRLKGESSHVYLITCDGDMERVARREGIVALDPQELCNQLLR
ncbi:hypothetical protein IPA_02215 [Ignicoccus pacificus DSM 13166]|uniref:PIN domain-containing protein n=1 Tax=Ignicoccus pacificus DSM 13166 TaxID=940294 RepID=A0A977KAS2_9CREN|nr:hypothetical protein IPA_02215 [Ignicoccus pacificus DSM 13166]